MQPRRLMMRTLAAGAVCAGFIPATIAVASGSDPSTAGDDPYCAAHLELEAATNGEDPAAIEAAIAGAQAAAPDELQDAITTAIETAPSEEPPSPEFTEAYGALVDYVRENCGFAEIDVLAKDYSYGGIGGEVAAGPTIINLINEGTEFHEIVLLRRGEGVTMPVEELLALPEEEAFAQVTFAGFVIAAPGTEGSGVVDLAPGEYIALCFIPKGTTPEAMEEMMAAEGSMAEGSMAEGTMPEGSMAEGTMPEGTMAEGSMPAGSAPEGSAPAGGEGPPHFMEGMIVEFSVVEGGATDTGTTMVMDMTATTEAGSDTTAAG